MKAMVRVAATTMLAALAFGCSSFGNPPTDPPVTDPPASPSPMASPQATQAPTPTATATPSGTAMPSPTEDDLPPGLPVGEIAEDGQAAVYGHQGSWCYDGACLDGPGLPKDDLPLLEASASDVQLTFSLAETHPFTHWAASYAADEDEESTPLASGGESYDPYVSAATPGPWITTFDFESPPSGDWVLRVFLQFGDRGDSTTTWHVVVP
jgi:hypothetical protein